jgi:hypothetical protein
MVATFDYTKLVDLYNFVCNFHDAHGNLTPLKRFTRYLNFPNLVNFTQAQVHLDFHKIPLVHTEHFRFGFDTQKVD